MVSAASAFSNGDAGALLPQFAPRTCPVENSISFLDRMPLVGTIPELADARELAGESLHSLSKSQGLELVIRRIEAGALLPDRPANLQEVVGVLGSYGWVLEQYSRNLVFIAERQFLRAFVPFKYFNGEIRPKKLLDYWLQKRHHFEYAEYCARTMYWHGAPGLNAYLKSPDFEAVAKKVIQARLVGNPFAQTAYRFFPEYLQEIVRRTCYYHVLGQFWRVMSRLFLTLATRHASGQIRSIPDVVAHIARGLAGVANLPLGYSLPVGDWEYELIPERAGLRWLADAGVPYVESIFFRAMPPQGVFSYDASRAEIPAQPAEFRFGALYANMSALGNSGVAPTLLMRDLYRHLDGTTRNHFASDDEGALLVTIGKSFQKSMFCVTNAALLVLAPQPGTPERRTFLREWAARIDGTRLLDHEPCNCACDAGLLAQE